MALSLPRAVAVATAVAGTLDILAAFLLAWLAGIGPAAVLRFVASGPFPAATKGGAHWAVVGLAVHYGIMTAMALVFLAAARRLPAIAARPLAWGMTYGLGLWVVMYWIVRPLRWPGMWPRIGLATTVPELVCHMVLVGLTFGIVARAMLARPGRS
ncbi:hypothetical protein [Pseudoxanthomonas suwonensis]|uniref:DUF1440 domain-containing protein n=1 Tax=Pseudoxanthomonas suwonensis TaxID=314722 RepID=A0A0E3Z1V9_9GAMM|nr:hypothetical protein [Pseudoxanthomonas suwonensis]AKC86969.1 hypothetical protein WQ53_09615 [Pseudoxanthomonas suwonensis]